MTDFLLPDTSDKRIAYAGEYLESRGFSRVYNPENADFVLLGINPKSFTEYSRIPVYAGNVCASNVFDYTRQESFALENAYLTAEGAIALAASQSEISLVGSGVLIVGYGRIGKALHRYLSPLTPDITICARGDISRELARLNNAAAITHDELKRRSSYDFVFNTVPHPVINEPELRAMKSDVTIMDLASFPGGVDVHFCSGLGIKLIVARGLPAEYSPKTAGIIVARTVENMILGGE